MQQGPTWRWCLHKGFGSVSDAIIFITGGTGVLGSRLVVELLKTTQAQIFLLLRAKDESELQRRFESLKTFWFKHFKIQNEASRVTPVRGDILHPDLILDASAREQVLGRATHIVHSAANVKMNMSEDEARKSIVGATEHLIQFARKLQNRGQFEKFEYVSTVGIAGKKPGDFLESFLLTPPIFNNTYEWAKFHAEIRIAEEITKGLPVTVHRPSMIVGDSQTGAVIDFQIFYYLAEYLTGRWTFGVLPSDAHIALDIVPSDYVAQILAKSLTKKEWAGRILHESASEKYAIKISDLIGISRRHFQEKGQSVPTLISVSSENLIRIVNALSIITFGKMKKKLQNLKLFLNYLNLEQNFENKNTLELIRGENIKLPEPSEYLDKIFEYFLANKKQKKINSKT